MGITKAMLGMDDGDNPVKSPAEQIDIDRDKKIRSLEERYRNEPSVTCKCIASFVHRGRPYKRDRVARFPESIAESLYNRGLVEKIGEPEVVVPVEKKSKRGRPPKDSVPPDTGPPADVPPVDDGFDLQ